MNSGRTKGIVSLCSSTLDESPRGASFLLSPNRLNVAVSRAEALAIVVGSPDLIDVRCRSVDEMRLVNLLCHLVQYAEEHSSGVGQGSLSSTKSSGNNTTRNSSTVVTSSGLAAYP